MMIFIVLAAYAVPKRNNGSDMGVTITPTDSRLVADATDSAHYCAVPQRPVPAFRHCRGWNLQVS